MTSLTDLAYEIRVEVARGQQHGDSAELHYGNAGRRLIAAKGKVKRGEWEAWLKRNCLLSKRRAQELMQIGRKKKTAAQMRERVRKASVKTRATKSALRNALSPQSESRRSSTPAELDAYASAAHARDVAENPYIEQPTCDLPRTSGRKRGVQYSATTSPCDIDWENLSEEDFGDPTEAYIRKAQFQINESMMHVRTFPLLSRRVKPKFITEQVLKEVRDVANAWKELEDKLMQRRITLVRNNDGPTYKVANR